MHAPGRRKEPFRRRALDVTQAIEIEAPVDRVFGLIEKPDNARLWMRGLEETHITARGADGPVGTRFKQRIREGRRIAEYDGEITAHERPSRLAVRIGNERFAFDVEYRLTDVGGRTRLDYAARAGTPGPGGRLAAAVFGWLTRRIARKQLQRLKAVAERR